MRKQLTLNGKFVQFGSHGGMLQKMVKEGKTRWDDVYEDDIEATLADQKKRFPDVNFDGVEPVDEDAEAAKSEKALAEFNSVKASTSKK